MMGDKTTMRSMIANAAGAGDEEVGGQKIRKSDDQIMGWLASVVLLVSCLLACGQGNTVPLASSSEAVQGDTLRAWKLDTLVAAIAAENRVDDRAVGIAGVRTAQYDRYVSLTQWPIPDLRRLTMHSNLAVRCYSGWALAEKEYPGLDTVLVEFLKDKEMVETFSGCIQSQDPLESELYHAYWNHLRMREPGVPEIAALDDPLMFRMDSIVLYSKGAYWLLLTRALENRVYPTRFNKRIAELAFREKDLDAVYYLYRNARGAFEKDLRSALAAQLQKQMLWPSEYLDVATMVLGFDDPVLQDKLLKRMKSKDNWKHSKAEFEALFAQYGIELPPVVD